MVNIAILGFGVVGSGTAEVLTENKKLIEERLGCEYRIKYILDLREFPESPFNSLVVHDFNTILNDPEVSIVAEMMGGSHPAYDFSRSCLLAGKSVVTSNKEVVANFGVELCRLARENGVRYLFEASVGGGIPIIRPMMKDLASNRISKINGILNGTTNYILTQMRDCGTSFEDALREAQKLGYAEANPAADIDGLDAARKIVILAAIASGKLINPKNIYTEGISSISLLDTRFADLLGYTVKLIGYSDMENGKLTAFVSPRMVPKTNPLCRIDGVFNGILVSADMVGEVMFYGPGAGKLPTASAVTADIIDIIANRNSKVKPVMWEDAVDSDVASFDDYSCRRMFVLDCKADKIPPVFVNIDAKELDGCCGFVTDNMSEKQVREIKGKLKSILISTYRIL